MTNIGDLAEPFPKEAIHWRIQGSPYARDGKYFGMALAYIDARDVMDRFDHVCGPEGWQNEFTETSSGRVICRLGVCIDGEWIWKSDGAGGTQVEAEKGGLSDALKRAAVSWGVGRYLYRLSSPWVECEVRMKDGKPVQNNGKYVWKRWVQNPWSAVKAPEPKAPVEFEPAIERDRLKHQIEGARTLSGLKKTWEDNGKVIERLKSEKPPMFKELEKAKDDRKAELTPPDPSNQAPEEFEGSSVYQ